MAELSDRELSPLELEALRLAADGLNYWQAARLMGRTKFYVKNLRSQAIQKLGADNMTQAVAMAIRRGIIS